MAWATKASLPAPRDLHAVAATATKVYALGGSGSSTTYEYDPATNAWATKAAMPSARDGLAAGAINGKVYAVGGWNSGVMADLYEYDPAANAWATKASMPTARRYLAAAVVDGKLYAIGGLNSSGTPVATVEMYDPATNTWTAKASLPAARSAHAAAAVGGKIYVVGGFNGSDTVATTYEYDPATNAWVSKASMPTGRRDLAAGAIGGQIYAVGGSILATVEAYDPATNTWASKTSMPTARNLAGGVLDGTFYAVGGYNGSTLAAVEAGSFNTAPNAPILTAPADASTIDRTVTQRFDWDFSDPDAGDTQSAYNLRYRATGAATWTETGWVSTPNTYHDIAGGTFADAVDYEWQVATKDAQGVAGPYSSSWFFTAGTAPTAPTITEPTNGGTFTQSQTVAWSTPDQDAYQIRVLDGAAVVSDTGAVESTTARSAVLSFPTNGVTRTIQVRVRDGGLWSQYGEVTGTVSWLAPPTPTFTLAEDPAEGALVVSISNPAPSGAEPAAVYNDVHVTDPGKSEERRATMVAVNGSWTYHLPVSRYSYDGSDGSDIRVVAVAENGVTSST